MATSRRDCRHIHTRCPITDRSADTDADSLPRGRPSCCVARVLRRVVGAGRALMLPIVWMVAWGAFAGLDGAGIAGWVVIALV